MTIRSTSANAINDSRRTQTVPSTSQHARAAAHRPPEQIFAFTRRRDLTELRSALIALIQTEEALVARDLAWLRRTRRDLERSNSSADTSNPNGGK